MTNLSLTTGLTKLTSLRVGFNQPSNLALPADMTDLTELSAFQNQLTNLTLPRRITDGMFRFSFIGPSGIYSVLASTDLVDWNSSVSVINQCGRAGFADAQPALALQEFYQLRSPRSDSYGSNF